MSWEINSSKTTRSLQIQGCALALTKAGKCTWSMVIFIGHDVMVGTGWADAVKSVMPAYGHDADAGWLRLEALGVGAAEYPVPGYRLRKNSPTGQAYIVKIAASPNIERTKRARDYVEYRFNKDIPQPVPALYLKLPEWARLQSDLASEHPQVVGKLAAE